jgi:Ferredoxin-dependent bilin reductase
VRATLSMSYATWMSLMSITARDTTFSTLLQIKSSQVAKQIHTGSSISSYSITSTAMMRTSASVLLANLLVLSTIEVNSLLGFSNIASSRLAYNHHMVATMNPPVTIHPTQTSVATNDAVATNREKLPWSKSINPDRDLSYMPMFQAQLDLMRSMGMEEVSLSETLVYRSSSVKPARIGNACFKNDKFRKVRLTYFDAGDNVQVHHIQPYPQSTFLDLKTKITNSQPSPLSTGF